jgi:hypothetical protein
MWLINHCLSGGSLPDHLPTSLTASIAGAGLANPVPLANAAKAAAAAASPPHAHSGVAARPPRAGCVGDARRADARRDRQLSGDL